MKAFRTTSSEVQPFKIICSICYGKWFEPRSLSRLCGFIVRVRVVPRRTVVGDIDRRFDNLSGSHHESHVNCVSSVNGIYVSAQLIRDVIGCFKSNRWFFYLRNGPDKNDSNTANEHIGMQKAATFSIVCTNL